MIELNNELIRYQLDECTTNSHALIGGGYGELIDFFCLFDAMSLIPHALNCDINVYSGKIQSLKSSPSIYYKLDCVENNKDDNHIQFKIANVLLSYFVSGEVYSSFRSLLGQNNNHNFIDYGVKLNKGGNFLIPFELVATVKKSERQKISNAASVIHLLENDPRSKLIKYNLLPSPVAGFAINNSPNSEGLLEGVLGFVSHPNLLGKSLQKHKSQWNEYAYDSTTALIILKEKHDIAISEKSIQQQQDFDDRMTRGLTKTQEENTNITNPSDKKHFFMELY